MIRAASSTRRTCIWKKLIVGPGAKGAINLSLPLEENLQNIAKARQTRFSELTVTILAKTAPRRHYCADAKARRTRVFAIPDGDVAASILTCMPDSEVDVLVRYWRRAEGGSLPAVIRALDGDMQARLLPCQRGERRQRREPPYYGK